VWGVVLRGAEVGVGVELSEEVSCGELILSGMVFELGLVCDEASRLIKKRRG